jgi:transcriptional regulator with XRE-family HTH domain
MNNQMGRAKSEIAQKLGQRVRALRRERDLTQERLAEAAHLSVNYISGVERGLYSPSLTALAAMAKALSVEIKDLFDFHD